MNREGSLDGVSITSSKVDKEYILRGSSGSTINLPHFFFEHLEWNLSTFLKAYKKYKPKKCKENFSYTSDKNTFLKHTDLKKLVDQYNNSK